MFLTSTEYSYFFIGKKEKVPQMINSANKFLVIKQKSSSNGQAEKFLVIKQKNIHLYFDCIIQIHTVMYRADALHNEASHRSFSPLSAPLSLSLTHTHSLTLF